MADSTHASSKKGHISAALRELKLSALQQLILVLVRLKTTLLAIVLSLHAKIPTNIGQLIRLVRGGRRSIRGRRCDVRDILVVLVTDVLH